MAKNILQKIVGLIVILCFLGASYLCYTVVDNRRENSAIQKYEKLNSELNEDISKRTAMIKLVIDSIKEERKDVIKFVMMATMAGQKLPKIQEGSKTFFEKTDKLLSVVIAIPREKAEDSRNEVKIKN